MQLMPERYEVDNRKISFLHIPKGSLDPFKKQSVMHVCSGNGRASKE